MITLEPLAAPLGALVKDFDPTVEGDSGLVGLLTQGLQRFGVLVFRPPRPTSDWISSSQLVSLGRSFGGLEILPEPDKRDPDHPEIFNLTNVRPDGALVAFDDPQAVFLRGTQRWHTDSSFREIPALCTMLYGVEVPPQGGATQFADMRLAYERLSPSEKAELQGRRLVHSYEYSRSNNPGDMEPMTAEERAKYPAVEHWWVRTNADGAKSLYMGGHASHIVGEDPHQSRIRFAALEEQLLQEDVVYEHQWRPGDLVVWDNRTMLHRLMSYDIAHDRRVMRRITVAGSPTDWPRD